MNIEREPKLNYHDVLIRPKRSKITSRKDVSLERQYTFMRSDLNIRPEYDDSPAGIATIFTGVPIMAANMDGVGTFEMADELIKQKIFTCLKKDYTVNELVDYFDSLEDRHQERSDFAAMTIGISHADFYKFSAVYEQTDGAVNYICIDAANGYTERFVSYVKHMSETFPKIVIIAGNVVTADQTQELILNGAHIVKVGIGPGSVCTTRIKTGVGYPQLSAVIECADAAHGLGGRIIADGGCACSGDVAKAFAGGADFVMLGGMLAGHSQGGGEVILKTYETNELIYELGSHFDKHTKKVKTKQFVQFYGMSSTVANDKHSGGLKEYRSSEGRDVEIPYRGEVEHTIQDILGGLRSACSYVGATQLKHLSKCTTFVLTSAQFNSVFANL
jgi:GMP reductase|tara:strand:- start:30877 stop:32043 length:1167 start_codon:yes stop_codon:yes gene_type:complete